MQTASHPRKDFTPRERQRIVSACQRSDLTQREYARQAGIGCSTLRKWLREVAGPPVSEKAGFIEVPNLLPSSPAPALYRLHLPNERLLEIASGFQPEEVAALLSLLTTP
jgi:hypothetical protein